MIREALPLFLDQCQWCSLQSTFIATEPDLMPHGRAFLELFMGTWAIKDFTFIERHKRQLHGCVQTLYALLVKP
jgi:hypothetical protein